MIVDEEGCTLPPVFDTAYRGNLSALRSLLLLSDTELRDQSVGGRTPLHAAAARGHEECVKALLSHGVDPACVSNYGFTALDEARAAGHSGVASLLSTILEDESVKVSPSDCSDDLGFSNILSNLTLSSDSWLSATNKWGPTMFVAAYEGNVEGVVCLVKGLCGATETSHSRSKHEGLLPLHAAALTDSSAVIRALLAAGVDPNEPTDFGESALHLASRLGHHRCVASLCAHPTTDVSLTNNRGLTPLHLAAFGGTAECAKACSILLATRKICVEIESSTGKGILCCMACALDLIIPVQGFGPFTWQLPLITLIPWRNSLPRVAM